MLKTKYIELTEKFNADMLSYIVNNFDQFINQIRPSCFEDENYSPSLLAQKYLYKSRHGTQHVLYKQNDGYGRFYAVRRLSLQSMTREIRNTITDEKYIDIDVVNAHPVLLLNLCKINEYEVPYLEEYVQNRDKLFRDLKIERDRAKLVYLCLINGGVVQYKKLKYKTDHIIGFKTEMEELRDKFAIDHKPQYEKRKEKRKAEGKDYNHEASYVNWLLCDQENKMLQVIYQYFKSPKNAVLCFDGIMLERGPTYDLDGCMFELKKKFPNVDLILKEKPMNDRLTIPLSIPKYNYFKLEKYSNFKQLISEDKVIYKEWVDEWKDENIILIEDCGKMFFLTKNIRIRVLPDMTKEKVTFYEPVKMDDIKKSLYVECKIENLKYNINKVYEKNGKKDDKKKKKNSLKSKEEKLLSEPYLSDVLGYGYGKEKGYISECIKRRHIRNYDNVEFFPFLKRKGNIISESNFNLFTGFPLEDVDIDTTGYKFEDSKIYKHLKSEFFNNNMDEFNHFLDHVADIIQDPAVIKGPSHIFYTAQGMGKGLLIQFIGRLLGSQNYISISNPTRYFGSNFNANKANKLLKVFEEIKEKGDAFQNHDRLKAEQTMVVEEIEPKGINAYETKHCARYWYCTNNENGLYIENDNRRHTMHRANNRYANDIEYFAPLWESIKDKAFLKCAFEFFATRQYEMNNVLTAFETNYKKSQKETNLPLPIKFLIEFIITEFNESKNEDKKIICVYVKEKYKEWLSNKNNYHYESFIMQLQKIGIEKPKKMKVKKKIHTYFIINIHRIEQSMKVFMKDQNWSFNFERDNIEENEKVIGLCDNIFGTGEI